MTALVRRRKPSRATLAGSLLAFIALGASAWLAHAQDSMSSASPENQRTEAGVVATDQHWSMAEMTGDTAYLEQMLMPGYRTVGISGVSHSKEAIIANAATRKGTTLAKAEEKLAAYRKEHPYGTSVVIHGDTAVVSFYDPSLGAQKGIKSSDVFVYADGHWHALYSQHTELSKG